MAKKRSAPVRRPAPPPPERPALTPERFIRLYKLVELLGAAPRSREQLLAALGLDVRGFYRDLELLRAVGIAIGLEQGHYVLPGPAAPLLTRLPFPDPHLSLGEARQLARGRGLPQRRLQEQIDHLLG